jgi:hypothetical protein
MKSWNIPLLLLVLTFLPACAVDAPETQKASQEQPVRISDAEAEKALGSAKAAAPRLHDPAIYRDPSLFVDLDAFIRSEKEGKPSIAPKAATAKPRVEAGDPALAEGHAGEAARR